MYLHLCNHIVSHKDLAAGPEIHNAWLPTKTESRGLICLEIASVLLDKPSYATPQYILGNGSERETCILRRYLPVAASQHRLGIRHAHNSIETSSKNCT